MIPRLDIRFPLKRQWEYWYGKEYRPNEDCRLEIEDCKILGEYLLNHARSGIVMALRAALPHGGRVGVVAYNCHTVANAVVNAGCTPVFVDVTEELKIDVESVPTDLDAIVVTNLFGIRNDIEAIRKWCPEAVVIVDNAHGYGLPVEGDFTIYSINQGKFPALGEGGILYANKNINKHRYADINIDEQGGNQKSGDSVCCEQHPQNECSDSSIESKLSSLTQPIPSDSVSMDTESSPSEKTSDLLSDCEKSEKNIYSIVEAINKQYEALPKYGFVGQVKLFVQMWVKAVAYSKLCYWFVRRLKKGAKLEVHQEVVMKQMAPGIRRMYKAWLPNAKKEIERQKENAEEMKAMLIEDIKDWMVGENGFMAIIRTKDVVAAKADFAKRGVETETHFARCIDWAMEFGYKPGSCPIAEKVTKELLMIPTYVTLKV